jgi:hypothetical protein
MALGLTACGSGEWRVETWGEAYIEDEIPAADFADGCSATFDSFSVNLVESALLDGNGEVVGQTAVGRFEMTTPGPQEVGVVSVPARFYDTARFVIAPDDGSSIDASGTVTCGSDSVTFDWSFSTDTTYACEPVGLTIPSGGTATTQLTVHGDHFFYDGLENPDAEVRGQAIVDADADEDGEVTMAELEAVDVAPLGYSVGQYSEVTNLGEFITFLTQTLGHVDGEGHCQVDL